MERESVWDYPRPPRLETFSKPIQVIFNGETIVTSTASVRILETSHPPVYYIPQNDIAMKFLKLSSKSTYCEWKGQASYWDLKIGGQRVQSAAWSYADPTPPFSLIKNYLAFYAEKMETCTVGGEPVRPQAGNFYGGWITDNLIGPFKGGAGSHDW